ncbi:MAG TPA: hypothetical protein VMY05_08045 [Acidobacteriota bacterium]|nr:hypothetical protein [Acidobacteriota bacterium]
MKSLLRSAIYLALGIVTALSASARSNLSLTVIVDYFDVLSSGNFETARLMWTPEAQERAGRFDIEYTGIPLKIDCVSPIVQDLAVMTNYMMPAAKNVESLPGDRYFRLHYSQVIDDQLVEHFYYTRADGDWQWFCYPQDYYAEDWPIVQSRYFRVHVHPDRQEFIHQAVLEEADRLVEGLAGTLHLSGDDLRRIEDKKIEFFYCSSDQGVATITGQATRGVLDKASNDIISASFPHLHELVHLLVNIKLQRLPLYTLPVVAEGVAVAYGGRWGKNAEALMDLGVFLHREKLIELDSILTLQGFQAHTGADIAYPMVGVFAFFLIDRMGQDNFLDLYLALSGDFKTLSALTTEQVQETIAGAAGVGDWEELKAEFERYIDQNLITRAAALPGRVARGRGVVSGERFSVDRNGEWFGCVFAGAGEEPVKGSLLFSHDKRLDGKPSVLFTEQFDDRRPFEGYRYAVRFDENEAGLYDYATNRLLAKYIWGISPSEEYFDRESRTIAVKFRRDLVDGRMPARGDCVLLPE